MNKSIIFYCAIGVAILSSCLLFVLRIVPTAQVWDKYNVLYVDIQVDVDTVRNILENENISNVLYPNHANFPLPSPLAPVQYHQFKTDFTYDDMQMSYFFDREKNYHLYYVPQEHVRHLYEAFAGFEYAWGIDSQSTVPAFPFLVSALVIAILLYFTKNKIYFLCILFPYMLYTIVAPFYHSGVAVCLFSLAVFMLQKYWNRQFYIETIIKNAFVIVSFSLLCISSILLGIRGFALFIFASLLSASLLYLVSRYKQHKFQKYAFKPIYIHTAKTIRIHNIYNVKYMLIGIFAILILTVFALTNIQPLKKNIKKALHIPSPSGYTVEQGFSAQAYQEVVLEEGNRSLPDLTDFISTAWHFETYPYLKLDDSTTSMVLPGETVERINYIQNGFFLEEYVETIALFDDAYIQKILNNSLIAPNAGAEQLLANQRGFTRVNYSQNGTITSPTGAIVFIILSCIYSIYILVTVKVKGR